MRGGQGRAGQGRGGQGRGGEGGGGGGQMLSLINCSNMREMKMRANPKNRDSTSVLFFSHCYQKPKMIPRSIHTFW